MTARPAHAAICLAACWLAALAPSALGAGGPGKYVYHSPPRIVAPAPHYTGPPALYVFLFIGDGFGLAQRTAAELYLTAMRSGLNGAPREAQLVMNGFPAQGMCTTYAANTLITESAAAATALATGQETHTGVVSMDPSRTIKLKTIAEMAKEKGMKVGILSTVHINGATPACFYAHQPSRDKLYEIGLEMAKSDFDLFGAAGIRQPKGKHARKGDVLEIAKANGFTIVTNRRDFQSLHQGIGKVVAVNELLDNGGSMPYEIDRSEYDLSLADYTRKAIDLLDNPAGFFMMVEGGKIDWACHANDAATTVRDILAFDAAVAVAVEFYNRRPGQTLIVVTGDHECGAMSLGFAATKGGTNIQKLQYQKMSYMAFDEEFKRFKARQPSSAAVIRMIKELFGLEVLSKEERERLEKAAKVDPLARERLGMALADFQLAALQDAFKQSMSGERVRSPEDHTYILYGGYEPFTVTLTHILNQKAGVTWGSYGHTASPLPVSAVGAGHELFNGYYHNTDVAKKIIAVMFGTGK
ncbi:MAG: alkaline phosphatase [Kiritimatiellae bacterium]|nr:alkaline phosphatase [Kiritimatiellia bacterium]